MVPITNSYIEQVDPPRSPQETLPTMYDLPSEDPEEPGLPDEFHDLQPQLLSRTLRLTRYSRDQYFTSSDLNVYYDRLHPQWYKRCDWFLAVGVPRLYNQTELRRSYVTWIEPHPPYVVIEFLSVGTELEDLGRFHPRSEGEQAEGGQAEGGQAEGGQAGETEGGSPAGVAESEAATKPPGKLQVYEEYLRVPHYLVYTRLSQQLRYFKWVGGRYQEQSLNANNPLVWLDDLEIGLGIWQGMFDEAAVAWLRWCDRQGNWLLTDTEQAELAQEAAVELAEQERLARERAEQLAETERLARQAAERLVEQERLAREQAEQWAEQERLTRETAQNQLLQAARNLLATGMDRDQVAAVLGLSEEQLRLLNGASS
ncbi:MAG: Uma2 family endonuclease [Oculatellaceae cyanobacterium Prado106]|nr:Uma2 family endonuclease [Oculatellaceae cyanobacterium Prado106]